MDTNGLLTTNTKDQGPRKNFCRNRPEIFSFPPLEIFFWVRPCTDSDVLACVCTSIL